MIYVAKWLLKIMQGNRPVLLLSGQEVMLTRAGWRISGQPDKSCNTSKLNGVVLMPPSHQTSSQYVLENVAERAQTVCERSGRSGNFLQSFYELHGRARTGRCSRTSSLLKIFWRHPVLQLDGVTTYLKRDGRTTNGIAVLLSY